MVCPRWNPRTEKDIRQTLTASSHTTSGQIEEDKVETGTDFISLGSKITVDGDYSDEIKRHLLLGKKPVANQTAY